MYEGTFEGLIETNDVETLQKLRVAHPIAKVGDIVLCGQTYAYVRKVIHWHPSDADRPSSPVYGHYVAVQIITDIGDRWWGYSLSDH